MTKYELRKEYFVWMCQLVNANRYSNRGNYRRLLRSLNETEFVYDNILDRNRASDGVNLRYRFAYSNNYEREVVAASLGDRSCSVLEMMVALALRFEEHVMSDPEYGNRTGQWFWSMVDSLGLISMTDHNFNQNDVDFAMERFLTKNYSPDGSGGLFTVHDYNGDIRSLDIWYQMCAYLESIS